MSTTHSYAQPIYTALANASSSASSFYRGAKSFTYEIGKECAGQALSLAPSALLGAAATSHSFTAEINPSDAFGYALGLAQISQGTIGLITKPIQALRGKATLLSVDSFKEMAGCAAKVAVGSAMLFAPTDLYPEDMDSTQFFLYSTLIINSLVTAAYLSKQACTHLKESHLLQKVSPFSSSTQSVKWDKVAKSISSTVLGSVCFFGAYKKVESALGEKAFLWFKRPPNTTEVLKHLPREDSEKVEAFFTINTKGCNTRYSRGNQQTHLLGGTELWQCYENHEAIRDQLLQDHPDLLAEIYNLRTDSLVENINSFQSFLKKAHGYGISSEDLSATDVQKLIMLFSSYSEYQLEKIQASNLSLLNFDTSRKYSSDEFSLLQKVGILRSTGKGDNPNPAVFFKAASDWNGALDRTDYDHLDTYGSINFMKDHSKLYSATISSTDDMCKELKVARELFGTKMKEVYFNAHGSPLGMLFSKDTHSSKSSGFDIFSLLPKGCFEDNVAEDATVILDSCSTASERGAFFFVENIAGRIAKLVPKGKVYATKEAISGDNVKYQINESGESTFDLGSATVIRTANDGFSLSKFLFGWIKS